MFDGVADKMLLREELPERRLAAAGLVEKRLAAAGITDIGQDEQIGIVVDSNQQPIAGASVHDYRWKPVNETITDDHGVFRLTEIDSKDALQLLILKVGYSPRIIMGRPTRRKNILVILGNQTCLVGVVTGPDDKPVKGARIIASCGHFEYTPGHRSGLFPFETTSGDDGSYRLDVCSNRFDVKVSAPGVGVSRHSGVLVEPNQSVPFPIQLKKGIRFEAVVVDSATGLPFEGFELYTHDPPTVSARSNAQGKLVLEDLFPGVIEFLCGAGDTLMNGDIEYWRCGPLGRWWSPDAIHHEEKSFPLKHADTWQGNTHKLTFDIRPDMKPVKIIVEQGVTVTGLVTDPDGKPVEGATVDAALSGSGEPLGALVKVITDNEGRYRSVLPASHKHKYNMVVHDGEYQEWRTWANGISMPLQTKPGQVVENVDLKLTVPGVIRGRITSFGKPVADRGVYCHSFDGCENPHYDPNVSTAADGTFELKFVRPGKHYVLAKPRYRPIESDPKGFRIVEVKAGVVVDNVELDFKGKFLDGVADVLSE